MAAKSDGAATLDQAAVAQVVANWAAWRDRPDWARLATCFHEDGTIAVSWYSGSHERFIAECQGMGREARPGESTRHFFGLPWTEAAGDRAVAETPAVVQIRARVDGTEVDIHSWLRFTDFMERRQGVWRIARRVGIYDKDRMDPVAPDAGFAERYRAIDFAGLPATARHLCWFLASRGRTISKTIVEAKTPAEVALRGDAAAWLTAA
ncbi:MAG: nuclear transport factor 2 family protein [Candidatus Eiseniibacteriota bacterium]